MQDLKNIHLASQYLAAAGISFLDKEDDDSHTNLGYSVKDHQIQTWPLSATHDILALDLKDFSLKWISGAQVLSFKLDGKNHEQVLSWLQETSNNSGLEEKYTFSFHYDLPYSISEDFKFEINADGLELERKLRSLAHTTIKRTLSEHDMESTIRIWPHHFDTGALVYLPDNNEISIGLGLAIPDSMIDQHYFYISGYRGHDSIDPGSISSLTHGKWVSQGFKGGVLKAENTDEEIVIQFFREALSAFSQLNSF